MFFFYISSIALVLHQCFYHCCWSLSYNLLIITYVWHGMAFYVPLRNCSLTYCIDSISRASHCVLSTPCLPPDRMTSLQADLCRHHACGECFVHLPRWIFRWRSLNFWRRRRINPWILLSGTSLFFLADGRVWAHDAWPRGACYDAHIARHRRHGSCMPHLGTTGVFIGKVLAEIMCMTIFCGSL